MVSYRIVGPMRGIRNDGCAVLRVLNKPFGFERASM